MPAIDTPRMLASNSASTACGPQVRVGRVALCLGTAVVALSLTAAHASPHGPTAGRADGDPVVQDLRSLSVPELLARVPSDRWIEVDGKTSLEPCAAEIRRRIEAGLLSDDEWLAVLAAGDAFHTRARWPIGERLGVWIKEPDWMRRTKITLRAEQPPLGEVSADFISVSHCGNCRLGQLNRQRDLRLKPMPEGVTEVRCTVTIEQAPPQDDRTRSRTDRTRLWSGSYVLQVQAVHGLDEVFTPSSTASELEAIRSTLCAFLSYDEKGRPSGVKIRIGGDLEDVPGLAGLGVEFDSLLRRFNQTVGSLPPTLCSGRGSWNPAKSNWGLSSAFDFPESSAPSASASGGWTVEVHGRLSPKLLTVWEADRWWNGTLEVTLAEAIANAERDGAGSTEVRALLALELLARQISGEAASIPASCVITFPPEKDRELGSSWSSQVSAVRTDPALTIDVLVVPSGLAFAAPRAQGELGIRGRLERDPHLVMSCELTMHPCMSLQSKLVLAGPADGPFLARPCSGFDQQLGPKHRRQALRRGHLWCTSAQPIQEQDGCTEEG